MLTGGSKDFVMASYLAAALKLVNNLIATELSNQGLDAIEARGTFAGVIWVLVACSFNCDCSA